MTASIHTPVNLGLNVARTKLKQVVPVLLAFAMGACECVFFVVLCLSHQTYVMFLNVFLRTFPFLAHDPCLLECEPKNQTSSATFAFLYVYTHIYIYRYKYKLYIYIYVAYPHQHLVPCETKTSSQVCHYVHTITLSYRFSRTSKQPSPCHTGLHADLNRTTTL